MVTINKALSQRLRGRSFRERSRQITAAQDRLRSSASAGAWSAYLDLEHLLALQHDAVVSAAIRVAFRHGQVSLLIDVVRHLEVG